MINALTMAEISQLLDRGEPLPYEYGQALRLALAALDDSLKRVEKQHKQEVDDLERDLEDLEQRVAELENEVTSLEGEKEQLLDRLARE